MKEWVTVLRAADAAARWHVHQRRKGSAQEPYINHLLEVASLVAEATHGIKVGGQLIALHLMEIPKLNELNTTYTGPKNPSVNQVGWSNNTIWLDAVMGKKDKQTRPGTVGFKGISADIRNFHIGGYQICEKWLKDRKGQKL
jgi:hypothetical protein